MKRIFLISLLMLGLSELTVAAPMGVVRVACPAPPSPATLVYTYSSAILWSDFTPPASILDIKAGLSTRSVHILVPKPPTAPVPPTGGTKCEVTYEWQFWFPKLNNPRPHTEAFIW